MDETNIILLQHNESYWLLNDELLAAYHSTGVREFSTYPDYTELVHELSQYARVSPEQILVTAGSDAAIRLLAEIYAKEGKRVLLPVPTFYGYERIFDTVGLVAETVSYRDVDGAFVFPIDEIMNKIESGVDCVFLCQPNNPLGCTITSEDINRVLDSAREHHTTVVVDEAYYEFSGITCVERLDSQPLIIVRTLSKAFGLAGARVGYCIASKDTIETIHTRSLPWPTAHSSVFAALAGLKHISLIRSRVAQIIDVREQFIKRLRQISSITVYQSSTNFVLVRVPDSEHVQKCMRERGIAVARGDGMSRVPDAMQILHSTIRMSSPSPEHLSPVIQAFSEAVDNSRQS